MIILTFKMSKFQRDIMASALEDYHKKLAPIVGRDDPYSKEISLLRKGLDEAKFDTPSELLFVELNDEDRSLVKIKNLPLSVRTINCLDNEGIEIVSELMNKTDSELLKIPNFGRRSLNEVKDVLAKLQFKLKNSY